MFRAASSIAAHVQETALADLDKDVFVVFHNNLILGAHGALAVYADAALLDEAARLGHGGREAGLDEKARELPRLCRNHALLNLVGDFLVAEAADELLFGVVGVGGRVEV